MSHWDYRVLRTRHNEPVVGAYDLYEIVEAHYGDGNPVPHSFGPSMAYDESINGLRRVLTTMTAALDKPVIEMVDGKLVEVGS